MFKKWDLNLTLKAPISIIFSLSILGWVSGQGSSEQASRDSEDQLQREVRRDPQALGRFQPGQQVPSQDRQVREG